MRRAALEALLQDADRYVRVAAVEALRRLGKHATPHAEAIAARLENGNEIVRRATLEALVTLGEYAVLYAGAIAAQLEDADCNVREAAVETLQRLGEHAAPYAGVIAVRLEHADRDVSAIYAGTIAARLRHADRDVRRAAVAVLGSLGAHAAPYAGAITAWLQQDASARLRDANADVNEVLAEALPISSACRGHSGTAGACQWVLEEGSNGGTGEAREHARHMPGPSGTAGACQWVLEEGRRWEAPGDLTA
ncbi:hypothetical protein CYMTET_15889 [Cymbomonas tetramitiformis]|uniref:HEAT repeat domain-containing protein n=1 Tax=Cymbomonas tetramitiformis TaxID=36881 RepID=A0AAE0L8Q4_9CHLO|nr:hypothetical protein CYMTET_15889 [Cymbomonas tetramitiformis]